MRRRCSSQDKTTSATTPTTTSSSGPAIDVVEAKHEVASEPFLVRIGPDKRVVRGTVVFPKTAGRWTGILLLAGSAPPIATGTAR